MYCKQSLRFSAESEGGYTDSLWVQLCLFHWLISKNHSPVTHLASHIASHADAALPFTSSKQGALLGNVLEKIYEELPSVRLVFLSQINFNSHGHSLDDVHVRGNKQRKRHEMRLIFQLGTWQPRGLNSNFRFCWGQRVRVKNSEIFMARLIPNFNSTFGLFLDFWQFLTIFFIPFYFLPRATKSQNALVPFYWSSEDLRSFDITRSLFFRSQLTEFRERATSSEN